MRGRCTSSLRSSSAANADALAFDREPDEYRCAPFVELRLLDWAHAIARRYLYEEADRAPARRAAASDDAELAGLAAKIDREEVYHRLHAEMWAGRLHDEPRFRAAVEELWPFALGVRRAGAPGRARPAGRPRVGRRRTSAASTPLSSPSCGSR